VGWLHVRVCRQDLSSHRSSIVDPIHVNYRGVDVYEIPPNGQGITALIALNILEGFDLASMGHNSPEYLHTLIEVRSVACAEAWVMTIRRLSSQATRLAFADTKWYVCDPTVDLTASITFQKLLDKSYAATRRCLIEPTRVHFACFSLRDGLAWFSVVGVPGCG
jgi:gamma-glutamyltranspeptidase / glutathione hydrolase